MANLGDKIDAGGGRSYELLLELGRGGMGRVYLARVTGLGGFQRLVALKTCHPHLADEEEFARMFLLEARTAGQIGHPNVVSAIDVGRSEQELYLVMDYVEGIGLSNLLQQQRQQGVTLPVEIVLRIALDALAGLGAAHELKNLEGVHQGLVHRDISPANILVGLDGSARVLDFGIAKVASSSHVTRQGQIKGKLGYLAPEQFSDGGIDRRTDLYAMGVTLWEMLAGSPLYSSKTDKETVSSILSGNRPDIDEVRSDLPRGLTEVLDKALEAEPDDRYGTADEFSASLESLGVRAASHREVGEFIKPMCAAELEERREHARTTPVSKQRVAKASSAENGESWSRETVLTDESVAHDDAQTLTQVDSQPRPPSGRWGIAVALALFALGGLAFGLLTVRSAAKHTVPTPVATDETSERSLVAAQTAPIFDVDAAAADRHSLDAAVSDVKIPDAQARDVASGSQSSDNSTDVRPQKRARPVRKIRRKKKEFFPTGL